MKKISIYSLVAFTLLSLVGGCESDFLDVNQNPNDPTEVETEYLVAAAEGALAYYMGFEVNRDASLICQQWSSIYTQYWDVDKYRLLPTDFDNHWSNFYGQTLSDLNAAIKLSEQRNSPNIKAVCMLLQAYTYQAVTDMWGDAPFSQAMQIDEYITPAYDHVSDIYPALLSMIDDALDLMEGEEEPALLLQDVIYNGDLTKWKAFAQTLKLRLMMRMSNTDEFNSSDVAALIAEGGFIESNDGNAVFTYGTTTNNYNPLFERFTSAGRSNDLAPSSTIVDLMNETNDPRRSNYFELAAGTIEYIGNPNGYGAITTENLSRLPAWWYDRNNQSGMARPTLLMTSSEAYFLLAESAARGFSSGNVNDLYNQAVTQSMIQWEVPEEDISTFLSNNSYVDLDGLYVQKYISLYDQGLEAYSEWRRSGLPVLAVAANSQNGDRIPVRFPYPYDEFSTNSDNVPDDDINTPIWWDR
nr:SusD/RagB family nutrient-binding outer membrane lipoprotein [uncultured Carboxylicivirga sp.]